MKHDPVLFVTKLSRERPLLKKIIDEHLEDHGEIVPHILIAGYCRVVLNANIRDLWIEPFLEELEAHFSLVDDDPVSNLIAVSFIEHLPNRCTKHWILDLLNPKLRQQYLRFLRH